MKRTLAAFVLVSLCLTACGTHKHIFSEADCIRPATCTECGETADEALGHTASVGICQRCGVIQNEGILVQLNDLFADIMEQGTALIECTSEIGTMSEQLQYEQFLEADKHTATTTSTYEEILSTCAGFEELNTIVYQTNLLKNACPPPVSGNDATSLANQAVLYQLYFQQLSSSCSYLSESLDSLAGNGEHPREVAYYEEVPSIPAPDSIIYDISYHSTQNAPGNVQYMYLLGDSETDATLNYNLFLAAIKMNTELQIDISDSMAIIYQNGNMVSVMMASNDPSIGYFLAVSFQK